MRSGESLYKIATDNGITVDELKAANNLTNDAVKAGQTLVIPAKGEAAKHAAAKQKPTTSTYTVRKGDNLGKIAAKHGITVDQLKELNNLTDNNIMVGQSIVVPGDGEQATEKPAKAERAKPRTTTHTVRSGETLGAIAEKYGTTVSAIKRASGIKSDRISIGQKLTIPKRK